MIKITECPRDAMQGLTNFIPTEDKIKYLNLLLQVGFDRIDFGSFVSPKAIPQMKDTPQIVDQLNVENSSSSLLAIIANFRGAQDAAQYDKISILGFPFSVSETFQKRNTNSTVEESLINVGKISNHCAKTNKISLIYLSMGFGNPYGDPWNFEIVAEYARELVQLGVSELVLADTIGKSDRESILNLFPKLKGEFPEMSWGLHLHSTPDTAVEKIESAIESGCERLDTTIRGFGGCPMADDILTGNLSTENLLEVITTKNLENPGLDLQALNRAQQFSMKIFGS